MRLVICFVALIATATLAGTTATVTSETWELRDGDSHPISKGYKTYKDCDTAGKALPGKYLCLGRVGFTVVGVCDDVPKPEIKLVLDAQGFLVLPKLKVTENPDGTWGPTMEEGYVKGEYPNCWVLGLVPYTGEWHAPELPPTAEAGPWIEGTDPEWPMGTPCPEAAHDNCVPSPNKPKVPPPGCVSEFCVPT